MAEYTSLALGSLSGLIVFVGTIVYMNHKVKVIRQLHKQDNLAFTPANDSSARELVSPR